MAGNQTIHEAGLLNSTAESSTSTFGQAASIAMIMGPTVGGLLLFVLILGTIATWLGSRDLRKQRYADRQMRAYRISQLRPKSAEVLWGLAQGMSVKDLKERLVDSMDKDYDEEERAGESKWLSRAIEMLKRKTDQHPMAKDAQYYPELLPPEMVVLVSKFVKGG